MRWYKINTSKKCLLIFASLTVKLDLENGHFLILLDHWKSSVITSMAYSLMKCWKRFRCTVRFLNGWYTHSDGRGERGTSSVLITMRTRAVQVLVYTGRGVVLRGDHWTRLRLIISRHDGVGKCLMRMIPWNVFEMGTPRLVSSHHKLDFDRIIEANEPKQLLYGI